MCIESGARGLVQGRSQGGEGSPKGLRGWGRAITWDIVWKIKRSSGKASNKNLLVTDQSFLLKGKILIHQKPCPLCPL